MNTEQTLGSYPIPPAHYSQFASGPSAMELPDISNLGPTYRVFGQVVENPNFPPSLNGAPPIDRDLMLYEPTKGLKAEIIRLVDTLPASVAGLLRGIENNPNSNSHKALRDFDCRVKSLFHAMESLRPIEAKESVLKALQTEIDIRKAANLQLDEVLSRLE